MISCANRKEDSATPNDATAAPKPAQRTMTIPKRPSLGDLVWGAVRKAKDYNAHSKAPHATGAKNGAKEIARIQNVLRGCNDPQQSNITG